MTLLKTAFTSAALLAGGLVASTPDTADAQFRIQFGNGYGYNNGYYGGSRYYSGHNDGWRHSNSNRVWHDTSHYDYHPTTVYRHRDHYHVQPGHYDYHQTGHWDYNRGWDGHRH